MKKTLISFGLFLLFFPVELVAQDLNRNEFYVSSGYFFKARLYVWETDAYETFGKSVFYKAGFTRYISTGRLGLGPYVLYSKPEYDGYGRTDMAEFGALMKFRITASEKIEVKPYGHLGLRRYSGGAGRGTTLGFAVAVQYEIKKVLKPFIEIGFVSQPGGTSDDSRLTISPSLQISFGLAF